MILPPIPRQVADARRQESDPACVALALLANIWIAALTACSDAPGWSAVALGDHEVIAGTTLDLPVQSWGSTAARTATLTRAPSRALLWPDDQVEGPSLRRHARLIWQPTAFDLHPVAVGQPAAAGPWHAVEVQLRAPDGTVDSASGRLRAVPP